MPTQMSEPAAPTPTPTPTLTLTPTPTPTPTQEAELEGLRSAVYSCKRCASCREWNWCDPRLPGFVEGVTKTGFTICPIFKFSPGFETDFARGKVRLARGLLDGKLQVNERLLRKAYECTMCGNCYEHCPGNRQGKLDPVAIVRAMREEALNQGAALPKGIKDQRTRTVTARLLPEKWVPLELRAHGEGERMVGRRLGVFVGCATSCNVSLHSPTIAPSFLKTLQALDVAYRLVDEGWCCGNQQYWTGQRGVARAFAERNRDVMARMGLTDLVVTCAGCYAMFKNEYPRLVSGGLGVKVVHSSELLAELLAEGRLDEALAAARRGGGGGGGSGGRAPGGGGSNGRRVTYHDPCELGRKSRVFEAPRTVVRAVAGDSFAELAQTRENAWCCGGGGGVKSTAPGLSLAIAGDRIRQARDEGFGTIVTACPSCRWSLMDAVRAENADIEVVDIADFVYGNGRLGSGSGSGSGSESEIRSGLGFRPGFGPGLEGARPSTPDAKKGGESPC